MLRTLGFCALTLTTACSDNGAPHGATFAEPPNSLMQTRVMEIDFNGGDHDFAAGFADYPAGEESFYELASGLRPLPAPLDTQKHGFMLSGNNHSDDLLMFLQGPIGGLLEGSAYQAAMCIEFATDAPTGGIGVGGAPGESVYVKLGFAANATQIATLEDGMTRITADVGHQSQGGIDAQMVGNIAVEVGDGNNGHWQLKTLCTHDAPMHVNTHGNRAWVFVGFDSGFEATTTVYVTRVVLTLQQPPPASPT